MSSVAYSFYDCGSLDLGSWTNRAGSVGLFLAHVVERRGVVREPRDAHASGVQANYIARHIRTAGIAKVACSRDGLGAYVCRGTSRAGDESRGRASAACSGDWRHCHAAVSAVDSLAATGINDAGHQIS
jgi:hypothetical protein